MARNLNKIEMWNHSVIREKTLNFLSSYGMSLEGDKLWQLGRDKTMKQS